MRKHSLLMPLITLISACTFQQGPEGWYSTFNPPIVERHWGTRVFFGAEAHQKFCEVTSGGNGVKVVMTREPGSGVLREQVLADFSGEPGREFTLSINNRYYRITGKYFPANQTDAILQDLQSGSVAYTEWRELVPDTGGIKQLLETNVIPLREFAPRYRECLAALR